MKDNNKKTVIISIVITFGLFVALPAIFVILVDPYQIFHRPLKGVFSHKFIPRPSYQNAGLINSYINSETGDFDAILIGTSLSTNYLSSHIARMTPWKHAVNLAFQGMKPRQQQIIFHRALDNDRIKHVFLEIYPYQYMKYGDITDAEFEGFPAYLYNKSRVDDYRYIFNATAIGTALLVPLQLSYTNMEPLERLNYEDFGCSSEKSCPLLQTPEHIENVVKKNFRYRQYFLRSLTEIAAIDYSAVDRYLLSSLLPLCNQSISFDLFFPPVSMLDFSEQSPEEFDYMFYMLRYVISKTRDCHNMRVFAFNNEFWITGNLAHYHDPHHFYGGVQDYIIQSFGSGKHVMTMDNIADFESRFINNMNHYIPYASTAEEMAAQADSH